jgi:hypothetical protein
VFAIVPYIHRDRLGSDSHFMLKYSDLEACFDGRVENNVYLDVHSQSKQSYWRSERDQFELEGKYKLVNLLFNPRDGYVNRRERWMPWKDECHPTVVHCGVYALANNLTVQTGITRRMLREVVRRHVDTLVPGGLFDRQWQITAWLHSRERMLKCVSLEWKGMNPVLVFRQFADLRGERARVW